jgi:rhodanese-related sulfurtransferase
MERLTPNQIPEDAILVDVRDELEVAASPLSALRPNRVLSVPLSELEDGATPELPSGAKIIVVCSSGTTGELAGAYLEAAGAKNVSVLEGGVRGLKRSALEGSSPVK